MYFWRVENLKADLVARPMPDREALPYLITEAVIVALAIGLPKSDFNIWDLLGTMWSIGLAVLGTIYIFRQNGGSDGSQFLPRYFSIGWVVGVRYFVVALVLYLSLMIGLEIADFSMESSTVIDFLFFSVSETLYFQRIGHHVRDVVLRTASQDAETLVPGVSVSGE